MESPTKTIRPLELHSPSNSNIDDNTPSPNDSKGSAMKGATPSSSSVVAPLPLRLPDDDDNNDNENRHTTTIDEEDGRYEHPFYLSPIGCMDLSTPSTAAAATGTNNDMTLETPNNNNKTPNSKESGEEEEVNESFPDNRDETIEIQSSTNYNDNDESNEDDSLIGDLDDVLNEMNGTAAEEENQDDAEDNQDYDDDEEDDDYDEEQEGEEETEEERMQREIEESEALARQLMAEEAMESYAVSNNYLRENADQFSEEDLAALQAAMAEEDPESNNNEEVAEDEEDAEGDSAELSYDALLRLGERIGDVKEERWALGAQEQINRLPTLTWNAQMAVGKAENHTEVKCQVCQCDYEEGDVLRRLPCDHCFHKDCIDSWLQTKDTCALCRKSIVNFSVDV